MTVARLIQLTTLRLLLVINALSITSPVFGDELRLAYLQLTEIQPNHFQVVWKVPILNKPGQPLPQIEMDTQVEPTTDKQPISLNRAHLQQWQVHHANRLIGSTIRINGLQKTPMDVLLRIQYLDGHHLMRRLTPDAANYTVPPRASLLQVIHTYLVLGIEHILIGIDHLLFVLVLLLLVPNLRKLVWTITAFTVAHSITLSLAALGVIEIPIAPVEACIALSIVFVAAEILRSQQGHTGLGSRQPWLVAFAFGLLHGLGFAAALGEIGLPQTSIPAALLFFNLGVEIGQLLFVAIILAIGWAIRRSVQSLPVLSRQLPVYLIGSVAAFWTFERTASFW